MFHLPSVVMCQNGTTRLKVTPPSGLLTGYHMGVHDLGPDLALKLEYKDQVNLVFIFQVPLRHTSWKSDQNHGSAP